MSRENGEVVSVEVDSSFEISGCGELGIDSSGGSSRLSSIDLKQNEVIHFEFETSFDKGVSSWKVEFEGRSIVIPGVELRIGEGTLEKETLILREILKSFDNSSRRAPIFRVVGKVEAGNGRRRCIRIVRGVERSSEEVLKSRMKLSYKCRNLIQSDSPPSNLGFAVTSNVVVVLPLYGRFELLFGSFAEESIN